MTSDPNDNDHRLVAGPWLLSRAPIACRHVVSGSVSSPGRGSSHLSLALLGSLSVARKYLALGDGPPGFGLASTCRVLLRCRLETTGLSNTGLSPSVVAHSRAVLLGYLGPKRRSYNPREKFPLVWAVPLSLAATDGIEVSFFSSSY